MRSTERAAKCREGNMVDEVDKESNMIERSAHVR